MSQREHERIMRSKYSPLVLFRPLLLSVQAAASQVKKFVGAHGTEAVDNGHGIC